jgi:hypothetical protein
LPIVCVYLLSNVALVRFYYIYHPKEANVFQHLLLPIISFLLLLFPLGGNFLTQNFAPYTYFIYLLVAWLFFGIIVLLFSKLKNKINK